MALGATAQDVFGLVARDGLLLAVAGIAIGAAAAVLMGRSLATLLYAVTPGDPLTFAATVAVSAGRSAGSHRPSGASCDTSGSAGGAAEWSSVGVGVGAASALV